MKNIELNDLLIKGIFFKDLKVGLTIAEAETVLGRYLGEADIDADDVSYYIIEIETGIKLAMVFDKERVCYDLKLDLDMNRGFNLILKIEEKLEEINENTPFEKLLDNIYKLNIEWEFDKRRTYQQTICIKLISGIRLYYSFGNKEDNDYGLFSIRSILETHKFIDF